MGVFIIVLLIESSVIIQAQRHDDINHTQM